MKNTERFTVYIVGFLVGMVIVSMLMGRRAAKREQAVDPWHQHHEQVAQTGAEALPESVEAAMLQGEVLRFGYLPSVDNAEERVWLLNFQKSYPYVRVVETIETGALSYMAADQIRIELADDVDVTDLKPMLDSLKIRLRMFNRKERMVVLGVVSTEIDAVPATLQAIAPWQELYRSASPDFIEFK